MAGARPSAGGGGGISRPAGATLCLRVGGGPALLAPLAGAPGPPTGGYSVAQGPLREGMSLWQNVTDLIIRVSYRPPPLRRAPTTVIGHLDPVEADCPRTYLALAWGVSERAGRREISSRGKMEVVSMPRHYSVTVHLSVFARYSNPEKAPPLSGACESLASPISCDSCSELKN